MKKILFLAIAILFTLSTYAQNKKGKGTGMKFNDEAYVTTPMKAPLVRALYGSLPKSASLKNWAPYPKTQGSYGTCVGWSSAYCALSIIQAQKNNWLERTVVTDNAFSPGFLYNQIKSSEDTECGWGANINDAMEIMKTLGVAKYSDFSESCPETIDEDIFNKASENKIKDYAKIFDLTDYNNFKIQAVKKSLSENKPVVIGMKCPESFYNATDYWIPTEDYNGEFGGHAMCVIGYDDNQHGGAFEIQNSWGDTWGNSGYIWIKYQDFANFTKYAFELIDDLKGNAGTGSELSGSLQFILRDGNLMRASLAGNKYTMNQAYQSGTKFRLLISNNEPAYVYAIGSDATQKVFKIFPHKPGISPALTYKGNDVALPSEDTYIEMDNTVGTDYFCVIYSKEPINIDEVSKRIEKSSGSFMEKVKQSLFDVLIDFQNVQYDNNGRIAFKAISKEKTAIALLVEMKHTKY